MTTIAFALLSIALGVALNTNALILILIVACLVGLVFWAALKYLDIPSPFKGIVLFLIIVIFVLWVASVLT